MKFLVAFKKLRKATISLSMFFRPPARMERLGYHWVDFHEIRYVSGFRKSVEAIQI